MILHIRNLKAIQHKETFAPQETEAHFQVFNEKGILSNRKTGQLTTPV